MGLLDDAIREHLELKRRRGADASEISRQESDALGPVRRSPEGAPELGDVPSAGEPALDTEGVAAHLPEPPAPWEDETTVHAPAPDDDIYEPPPVPRAAAAPPPPPSAIDPPPLVPPVAPPIPATPPPAYEPPPAAYEPPRAPAHEPDVVPADEEPEGEDLLEETPDFLEETPEHDRLWFEQRPPRDFDFDG
jgi:hypothetical protein